jgi:hypothetical protein
MSRRWRITLGLGILAIAGGLYAWRQLPRDSSARVAVSDVVRKFRASVAEEPNRLQQVEGLPRPGVYRYKVSGGESLNGLIFSTNHRYLGTSTVTVTSDSCGVTERWQVLSVRWTEAGICDGDKGAVQLASLVEHHEFFGVTEQLSYGCGRDAQAGRSGCVSASGSILSLSRPVGVEPVEVGGEAFNALHAETELRFFGDNSGSGESHEWRRVSDGLLLRKEIGTDLSISAEGGGTYGESYSLPLLSPEPER